MNESKEREKLQLMEPFPWTVAEFFIGVGLLISSTGLVVNVALWIGGADWLWLDVIGTTAMSGLAGLPFVVIGVMFRE